MQNENDEKRFVCIYPNCGKKYRRNDHLKRHVQCHMDIESDRKPFRCPLEGCDKAFPSKYKLNRHLKSNVHNKKPTNVDQEAKHLQRLEKRRLIRQMQKSGKVHKCSVSDCSFQTSKWSELQSHITLEHPICCPVCEKTFSRRYGLKCHLRRVHNPASTTRVSCSVEGCSKSFVCEKSLKVHVLASHLNLKPFECLEPNCGAKFAHKHLLQRHKNVHKSATEIANQGVPVPTNKLSIKDDLTGKSYLKEQPDRTIPCLEQNCNFKFKRIYDRDRHVLAFHPYL